MLLTGSREAGEDLLQAALERLLRHWRTIDGDPEGYLRRTVYNLAVDGWRRKGRWHARLALQAESAEVLGCSISTVSSATARGLRRLRELSGATPAAVAIQQGGEPR